jgi:hypothetical protein
VALQRIYAERFECLVDEGRYSHRLWFRCRGRDVTDVDKVKVARAVVGIGARLDELDLRKRVSTLVRLIREAGR